MKVTKSTGMLLLGIWLIVTGAAPLLNFPIDGVGRLLMAVLAIAAGALIVAGK